MVTLETFGRLADYVDDLRLSLWEVSWCDPDDTGEWAKRALLLVTEIQRECQELQGQLTGSGPVPARVAAGSPTEGLRMTDSGPDRATAACSCHPIGNPDRGARCHICPWAL